MSWGGHDPEGFLPKRRNSVELFALRAVLQVIMKYLLFLLLCLNATAAERPNFLFIVVDDLACVLGSYGDATAKTPHMDKLAASGVRFERAYCQYPICGASRASFLSGRYPETIRVLGNTTKPLQHKKDSVFLPGYLRQQGYQSVGIGKIFHEGEGHTPEGSWDLYLAGKPKSKAENILAAERIKKPYEQRGLEWAALQPGDDESGDVVKARLALAELDKLAKNPAKPFFLAVGFKKPHVPYCAPQRYFDQHPLESVKLPEEPSDVLKNVPPLAITREADARSATALSKRESLRAYRACVTCTDDQIGLLLAELDRLALTEKTVVVLTSDHGYHLNDHGGMWHKMSLFDASARVPLLVRLPGVKPGVCPRPVQLIDLFPTFCELSQSPLHPTLEGRSLVPLLHQPEMDSAAPAHTIVRREKERVLGRSVSTGEFRFIEWDEGNAGTQLYDSKADPKEWKNLSESPDHETKRESMKKLIRRP
jgi:iduronate 2-sulfatase